MMCQLFIKTKCSHFSAHQKRLLRARTKRAKAWSGDQKSPPHSKVICNKQFEICTMSKNLLILINIVLICIATLNYVYAADEEEKKEPEGKVYFRPSLGGIAYLEEPFHSVDEYDVSWILSSAKKDGVEDNISKYDGKWVVTEPKSNPLVGDKGLVFSSEARHGAISTMLKTPFKFEDKPFIVQYEVRFQNKHECGGAYIKLLADTPSLSLENFGDKTEYSIMFGPDKCGGDSKLHFIFQHKNPITDKMEEKHAKKPSGEFSHIFDDQKTHLVRLIVKPDNSFEISVDKQRVNEGSLLHDMEPSVNPPKEIDDPEDKRPDDWDEREKIPDPDATKPDDWDENAPKKIEDANAKKPDGWLDDEPELIPDPQAVRPEDWDDEEDGEWEAPQVDNPKCKSVGCGEWKAPMIDNPNYKGKWTPPLIDNPKYKGIWAPRKIPNPDFFEDMNPFAMKPIKAVGFELWSMQADILFDNLLVVDDISLADQWTSQTWDIKHQEEVAKEPSAVSGFIENVKEVTAERPWLWILIVGAVLLPIALIYFFCFGGKKDKEGLRKKTDEPTPDDEVEEDTDADDEEGTKQEESGEVSAEDKDKEKGEEVELEAEKNDAEVTEQKTATEDLKSNSQDENSQDEEAKEVDNNEESEIKEASPRTRSKRKTPKE